MDRNKVIIHDIAVGLLNKRVQNMETQEIWKTQINQCASILFPILPVSLFEYFVFGLYVR